MTDTNTLADLHVGELLTTKPFRILDGVTRYVWIDRSVIQLPDHEPIHSASLAVEGEHGEAVHVTINMFPGIEASDGGGDSKDACELHSHSFIEALEQASLVE
jgi:hypothetical protein